MAEHIIEYNVTDAAIAEMTSRFMPLTIAGVEDRQGLVAVHDARMTAKHQARVDALVALIPPTLK